MEAQPSRIPRLTTLHFFCIFPLTIIICRIQSLAQPEGLSTTFVFLRGAGRGPVARTNFSIAFTNALSVQKLFRTLRRIDWQNRAESARPA